ncbi:MAG: NAD/NADP octopine/nopaline dehydrogenase family protein [Sarcina sp.]
MRVGIIGAGNIGTYLAGYISLNENNKVWIHTSKPERFSEILTVVETEKNIEHKVKIHKVTDNIEELVVNSELILITHPSFMVRETLGEVVRYLNEGTIVGTIPGFGGKEFYIDELRAKGGIYFGSQRVPSITRLEKYGEVVHLRQRNKFMKIAAIPSKKGNEIADILTNLIDIPCEAIDNYLGITLSPSNPTMHPSRLYELFKDYEEGVIYPEHSLFYEGWGSVASQTLLDLDEELKSIVKSLNVNNAFLTSDFEEIKLRYDIQTAEQLSEKIQNAIGFLTIKTPMISENEGFVPDLESRYFTEDLEYGLCIIKAFAELCNLEVKTVDKVVYWAQNLFGKEYIVEGKLCGQDVKNLMIPQNMGISTKEDLIKYYKEVLG